MRLKHEEKARPAFLKSSKKLLSLLSRTARSMKQSFFQERTASRRQQIHSSQTRTPDLELVTLPEPSGRHRTDIEAAFEHGALTWSTITPRFQLHGVVDAARGVHRAGRRDRRAASAHYVQIAIVYRYYLRVEVDGAGSVIIRYIQHDRATRHQRRVADAAGIMAGETGVLHSYVGGGRVVGAMSGNMSRVRSSARSCSRRALFARI